MSQFNRTNTILYCRQWKATVAFYRDVLGLPTTQENSWFVEFQVNGNSFLSIADASRTSIDDVGGQGVTLSWQVDDLSGIRVSLKAHGVEVGDFQKKWGSDLFYIHDPEGHRIEFWQAPTQRPEQPQCDLATSTTDWVIEYPESMQLFQKLGVDYCCGGKSLEYACREQELEPADVLKQLGCLLNIQCE